MFSDSIVSVRCKKNVMATALCDETEDLVTCSVCCCEYDNDQRKPKYLDCFHTFCIDCIRKMRNSLIFCIQCPLCRQVTAKAVDLLKTNVHALHIKELLESSTLTRSDIWCFTCSSLSTSGCAEIHFTVTIPSRSSRDGQELQRKFDKCQIDLDNTIKKRRDVQEELHKLLDSVEKIQVEIRKQMEQNDEKLARQLSAFEDLRQDSHETFEFLQHKFDQIDRQTATDLKEVTSRLEEQEKAKTVHWKIQVENARNQKLPSCRLFENGFSRNDNADHSDNELLVLTHLAYSINERNKTASPSTSFNVLSALQFNSLLDAIAPNPRLGDTCHLTLTVKQNNLELGHIRIQLSAEFLAASRAVLELSRSTGRQVCSSEVLKGSPDNFLALKFPFEKLCSAVSSVRKANASMEVGVFGQAGTGKGLFFLLKNANAIRMKYEAPRFVGTVTSDSRLLNLLSRKTKAERLPLTLHWEVSN